MPRDSQQSDSALSGLGARLRAYRQELGLTQREMAERLGIPFRSLQDNEKSKALPGARTLLQYLLAGADVNWLISGEYSSAPLTAAEKTKLMTAADHVLASR